MLFNRKAKLLSWVGIFVITYAVFILSQAFLANMFLAIPQPELFRFVVILIAPSLISGPLIYWSRRPPPTNLMFGYLSQLLSSTLCGFF
jgi:hypothetical protein